MWGFQFSTRKCSSCTSGIEKSRSYASRAGCRPSRNFAPCQQALAPAAIVHTRLLRELVLVLALSSKGGGWIPTQMSLCSQTALGISLAPLITYVTRRTF